MSDTKGPRDSDHPEPPDTQTITPCFGFGFWVDVGMTEADIKEASVTVMRFHHSPEECMRMLRGDFPQYQIQPLTPKREKPE